MSRPNPRWPIPDCARWKKSCAMSRPFPASGWPLRSSAATITTGSAADYVLTPTGWEALALMPERHKRLRALLGRLARSQASQPELEALARSARSLLKRAIESGWVASIDPPRPDVHFVQAHELTSEQQRAVDALCGGLEKFRVSLLFGVTGSGKKIG